MDGRTDGSHPPAALLGIWTHMSTCLMHVHVKTVWERWRSDLDHDQRCRHAAWSDLDLFALGFPHPNTYRSTCLLWICCCAVANANLLWKKSIIGWLVAADWCWFNIKKKYYWLNAVNRVSTYLLVNAPTYRASRVASRRESDPVQQNQWLLRVCLAGLEPAPAPSSCSVV